MTEPDRAGSEGDRMTNLSEHQARMQEERYLLWWRGRASGWSAGPLFSPNTHSSAAGAIRDRDMFTAHGFSARILRVTVVDGQPVAEWVDS